MRMDDEKLKQLAKEISRSASAPQPPELDMTLLERRMEQAALRGKSRRPSQRLLTLLSEFFTARPARYAIPAFCCALLLAFAIHMTTSDLPLQPYSASSLPVMVNRGDEAEWTWTAGGWAEDAELNAYTLVKSMVTSATTAQSAEPLRQLTCEYAAKGDATATAEVTVTVSEGPLPLWELLSTGESKTVKNTEVFFGCDETAGSYAAVWQRDGLTFSIITNNENELLPLVKNVLQQ